MEKTFSTHTKENLDFVPLNSFLKDSEMSLLNLDANLVDYTKHDKIIRQNTRATHILFIKQGLVKISKEVRLEKSLIFNIEGPNKFIGLNSVFGIDTYNYSVTALEPTTVSFIDIEVFKDIIRKNSALGLEFITQMSRENNTIIDKLSGLLYKQLPGRVADIILYFSEYIYQSQTFTIPLTRQELAELAGTTKESIIRTLSEFKNDKIIDLERNTVTVLSPKIIHTLSRLG